MLYLISFLIVFTIAVLVHELGHFLVARRCGVKAYEFSIGFPFSPKILTFFRHKETEFTIRLLPLGGFVSFSQDGNDDMEFLKVSRPKRFAIAVAGSVFNIISAIIFVVIAYMLKDVPLTEAVSTGMGSIWAVFKGIAGLMAGLATGQGSADGISGPIGIAVMAGKAAQAGFANLVFFTGMLSLSLGILNLLPLPSLDGGHIVILAVESIKKSPLSQRAYGLIGAMGLSLFLLLTVLVSYRDIMKILA